MPLERRNKYTNLILLCRNHHKVIDAQEGKYSAERLHQIKIDHEVWVADQLAFDAARQFEEETYAGVVDKWEDLAHVEGWLAWSSHVLSFGQPEMQSDLDRDLRQLRGWLLNRVWPRRYPDLKNAFENFRRVLEDFHECFWKHAEPLNDGQTLLTHKFYQIKEWDEGLYRKLLKQYEFHVYLVQDLMLELTRAANLVCDQIRQHLTPSYRLDSGRLMVQTGPSSDLAFRDIVVEYDSNERELDFPYPGFQAFLTKRGGRSLYFDSGIEP